MGASAYTARVPRLTTAEIARAFLVSETTLTQRLGPFAETKEQPWGSYGVEVDDLDAAIALVDGLWELDHGTIEIRPVFPAPPPPP